ncbi:CCD13 protein, partial [Acromyrmex heyeri]
MELSQGYKYQLLCSEVGKNISISTLLSTLGDWRRAEQIRCLQQKLVELQNSGNGRSQKELSLSDRKNLTCLRNAEKERRQQIENIAKELRQAEVALETSKRKLDASKARIKVLEQELSIMKGNIATLNEKRSHDNRLIDVLIERLKISEARYQDREVEVRNRENMMERENANIKNELRATQLHVDRLRRRLEEREIEIDKLRNGILSDKSFMYRISIHSDFRLIERRQISPSVVNPRSLDKSNEYMTLALAAEAKRARLLELITLLNQRELLREEKNKCAKLESKLRDSEKERVGLAKVDMGYKTKSCMKSMSTLRIEEGTINPEEVFFLPIIYRYFLRFDIFDVELLEEECPALNARLDIVQQDKASDLIIYKRMPDQARKTHAEHSYTRQTRQSFAIGIDVAATKPRYGDVTGTRDKVQRLHVNPRDIVGVKLAVSSPPRSSTVPLTSRRFSVCLNRLVYFCH